MDASLETLFLPWQNGDVPSGGRTLFVGAAAHPALHTLKPDCWQPFKPLADTLGDANLLQEIPADASYDLAFVNIPKQVDEARHWIACALYALKPDGWLVMAAANDANGGRLEKWAKELGLGFESATKNKGRVLWANRTSTISPVATDWLEKGLKKRVTIGDAYQFFSQPGVFGWDKIDAGSQLLTKHMPANLKGAGADFGAGTGYLSRYVLENNPSIADLYLVEADARALSCARDNIEPVQGTCSVAYVWADLTKQAALPPLNFIVMNPPFHAGKTTAAAIGQSFIETAAYHLKKGGRLHMVANAHLPYENILQQRFSSVSLVVQENGFKIFEAVK